MVRYCVEMIKIFSECGISEINRENYKKIFESLLTKYHPGMSGDENKIKMTRVIQKTYIELRNEYN